MHADAGRQCAALLLRCLTLVVANEGWIELGLLGREGREGGKRLDMQLEEQGQVQIPTTMGAKVEVEGYKPGHCAMGDLHASANGWRFPYEEETSNGFVTEEAAVYSEYDKEMFRRTMLAHEAVFRQQVYELHRVYRVQRDLMKQHQSREMHACSTLEDASQRNSPSQIPAHGANMIGTAPLNNEKSHSSKFPREGSVQSSPNGFPSSEATLPTKQGRFDLELGAEHYIEDDHASDKFELSCQPLDLSEKVK
ncbi:hypothetical protein ZWY2020_032770 [Hordeum vulgare]|nr:hypothetical protein ZWY2020_032770 [Hordeum vulgare]